MPPTNLRTDEVFSALTENLTQTLQGVLSKGETPHGNVSMNDTAYSASLFSIDDPDLLWEFHHTPDIIRNGSYGVREIDQDSVYRIGSISKLVTVYATLAKIGDKYWDRPVTEFLPELSGRNKSHENTNDWVQWEQVTLGQLAGQTSGMGRDRE